MVNYFNGLNLPCLPDSRTVVLYESWDIRYYRFCVIRYTMTTFIHIIKTNVCIHLPVSDLLFYKDFHSNFLYIPISHYSRISSIHWFREWCYLLGIFFVHRLARQKIQKHVLTSKQNTWDIDQISAIQRIVTMTSSSGQKVSQAFQSNSFRDFTPKPIPRSNQKWALHNPMDILPPSRIG